MQHEGDGGEGSKPVIGTVMRQGYKLGDQVLRHALVGVVDTVRRRQALSRTEPAADGDTPDETEQADTGDNPNTAGE